VLTLTLGSAKVQKIFLYKYYPRKMAWPYIFLYKCNPSKRVWVPLWAQNDARQILS
jgi:hypothetical protein